MLTLREALSGIFGSIALASWTTVFVPQLVENYRRQSAEAVSLTFLAVWILGDVLSLIGSIWAELLPVIIANGVAFCITDCIFLIQCLYYRVKFRRRLTSKTANDQELSDDSLHHVNIACECTPFLREVETMTSVHAPHLCIHRLPVGSKHDISRGDDENGYYILRTVRSYEVPVFVTTVIMIGSMGWLFAYRIGLWHPSTNNLPEKVDEKYIGAQILGSCSAIANLCARPPQIIKNMREKSCTGNGHPFHAMNGFNSGFRLVSFIYHPVFPGQHRTWCKHSFAFVRT